MLGQDGLVTSDAELLTIEAATLWTSDSRGRLLCRRVRNGPPAPHLVVAVAGDGPSRAWIGTAVPDGAVADIQALLAASSGRADCATEPAGLPACCELLAQAVGRVRVEAGPSYLIPPDVTFPPTVELALSDRELPPAVRSPASNWTADDWQLLLDGEVGPWAMAINEGRVVSICHSARLAETGAEAGVWTAPDFRGQGHAAAVTAAWASQLSPTGRRLFYSTAADNYSSQRVAARLGLRCFGWMWHVVDQ